jgi:hypothetical protein
MKKINMNAAQLKALQDATTATHNKLVPALVKASHSLLPTICSSLCALFQHLLL